MSKLFKLGLISIYFLDNLVIISVMPDGILHFAGNQVKMFFVRSQRISVSE